MKLKGYTHQSDGAMHKVEFEIDDEGMVSAHIDGEIFDYSDNLDDYVSFCNDAIFTGNIQHVDEITYRCPIKLSEWFKTNGAKGVYY
jgi:hypothetical protein